MQLNLPRILIIAVAMFAAGTVLHVSNLAAGVLAYVQSTSDFTRCTPDPRILCEPGAEALARDIAPLMATAVDTVERAQYGAFVAPVRVQVYRNAARYGRHSAVHPMSYGAATLGIVHLAPRLAQGPESKLAILTHELSHLHLFQQSGSLAAMRLPNWFMEGLPTLISDGGGAAGVSRDQAVFALVHGRHFEATAEGSPWSHGGAARYKLAPAMYYRQAELMVGYMRTRDSVAFEQLIRDISAGKRFDVSVQRAYGQALAVLWQDFRQSLRRDPAAVWVGAS